MRASVKAACTALLLASAYAVDHGVRRWAVKTHRSGQVALEVARAQHQMVVV